MTRFHFQSFKSIFLGTATIPGDDVSATETAYPAWVSNSTALVTEKLPPASSSSTSASFNLTVSMYNVGYNINI
jgi:hypothetical protein